MVGMIGGSQSQYQIYQGSMPFQQMAGSIPGAMSGGISGIGTNSILSGMSGLDSFGSNFGGMSSMNMGGMGTMSAIPGMSSMPSMGNMGGMGNLGIAGSTLQVMSQITSMMASVMQGLMSFVQTLVASNQKRQTEQISDTGKNGSENIQPTSGSNPDSNSTTQINSEGKPSTDNSSNSDEGSSSTNSSGLYPDQTQQTGNLNSAGCGLIAAMAFLKKSGKNQSLEQVRDYAKDKKLWGVRDGSGMEGPAAEQSLLKGLGVNSTMENGVNWDKVKESVQNGKPVIISTPKHYWVVEGYDPKTKKFNFGNSSKIVKQKQYMTREEYAAASGGGTHAFYLNN